LGSVWCKCLVQRCKQGPPGPPVSFRARQNDVRTRRNIEVIVSHPFPRPATADNPGPHLFAILEQMPKRAYLGEFELMILLALIRLGDDAYGVPISKELLQVTGREVALGSVYAALDRLERKQLVTSTLGDPTPERGGRAKRYFRVTRKGLREAETTRTALTNLWRGLPRLKGEHA
jgi:PadR family transcriptional regulator PadR